MAEHDCGCDEYRHDQHPPHGREHPPRWGTRRNVVTGSRHDALSGDDGSRWRAQRRRTSCGTPITSEGETVADRQTINDPFGIQPPRAVVIMYVCSRDGVTADGRRRPDRAGVVVAGGPDRLHHTSVDVPVRVAEPA